VVQVQAMRTSILNTVLGVAATLAESWHGACGGRHVAKLPAGTAYTGDHPFRVFKALVVLILTCLFGVSLQPVSTALCSRGGVLSILLSGHYIGALNTLLVGYISPKFVAVFTGCVRVVVFLTGYAGFVSSHFKCSKRKGGYVATAAQTCKASL
jgi:uncharacterized membrane protein YuzA (DUF378 family)